MQTQNQTLPIELWKMIIRDFSSQISGLKIISTCKVLYQDMPAHLLSLRHSLLYRMYGAFESTKVTHFLTDIPFHHYAELVVQLMELREDKYSERYVEISQLKITGLSSNFCCYELPDIQCKSFRICRKDDLGLCYFPSMLRGVTDDYQFIDKKEIEKNRHIAILRASKPDLVGDSEQIYERPQILEELSFSPKHCAFVNDYELPVCYDIRGTFTVIVCTGPLILNY